ncbi:hypothetical protein Droror1_Dr00010305 [Drosera rotundifolia]
MVVVIHKMYLEIGMQIFTSNISSPMSLRTSAHQCPHELLLSSTMETNQINYNAPLISARRYSSPQRSMVHEDNKKNDPISIGAMLPHDQKLDLSLGEIVHPGSVPFCWEKSPGKAKDTESESRLLQSPELHINIAPRLPPGRSLDIAASWTSRNSSGELKPAAGAHNRLSGEILKVHRPPSKPSGELNASGRTKISSSHISSLSRWEGSKRGMRRNANSDHDQTDDAAYSDTIGSFSQLESFSIYCSTSGVSGSDCPAVELPAGSLISTDVQAKDFMMNRFLPAAKAMTLESPQYVSRRQLVVVEPSVEAKALVPRAQLEALPTQCDSEVILPYCGGHELNLKEESEEQDVNCALPSSLSVKVSQLLPWFRSKKDSLQFLNPVPAMKAGTRAALFYASKIARLVNNIPLKGLGQARPKANKVNTGVNSSELHPIRSKSSPKFYSAELQARRSSSPYRNSRQGSTSPYRNVSPQPLYHKGVRCRASPTRVDQRDDHEAKLHRNHNKKSGEHLSPERRRSSVVYECSNPVAEKTLYVDSITTVRACGSNCNYSSEMSRPADNAPKKVFKREALQHGDRWDIIKARGICRPPVSDVVDGRLPSTDKTTKLDSSSSESRTALTKRKFTDPRGQVMVKADEHQRPLTPPLPKSPSDSWLLHNLNPGSPRRSFSSLHFVNKAQPKKQIVTIVPKSNQGAKWETIVKSSHLQSDHGRYSEELVSQTSKRGFPHLIQVAN